MYNTRISDYDLIAAYNTINHIFEKECISIIADKGGFFSNTFLLVTREDCEVIGEYNNLCEAIVSTYKFHQEWLYDCVDSNPQREDNDDELFINLAAFTENEYCLNIAEDITPAVYKNISEDFFIKRGNAEKFIYKDAKYIVSKGVALKLCENKPLKKYESFAYPEAYAEIHYIPYDAVALEAAEIEMTRYEHDLLSKNKKIVLEHAYDYAVKCEILGRIRNEIRNFFPFRHDEEDIAFIILNTKDFVDFCYNSWFDSDEDFCENLDKVVQNALEEKYFELKRLRLGSE